jgi:spermidine/putrescine transport system substrate-binding protein
MSDQNPSAVTLRAAWEFNRRTVLKGALAAGTALTVGPFVLPRRALGAGQVNVFAWGDYVQQNIIDAFQGKSGIKINLSTYGSNDEAENKLRAAGAKGFDIVFPSVDTGPNYYGDNLLMPIDESRFNVDAIIPSIYRQSITLGAANRGKRYLIPHDWGTEAVTWDSSKIPTKYGELSYADLWGDNMKGQVAVRQKSILVSLALYLDAIGEVKSNRAMDLYKTEDDCRRVFEACLAYAVKRKANIGAFWNNATEATAAFTDAGCTIGQTWDTTGILLHRNVGEKWVYSMPKEGGLGWMDTLAIPSGAENVDQAYEFIKFMLTPETGAMFANNTGYNSCAAGATDGLTDANKKAFQMAYPDQAAIDNLWWWPAQTPFFAELRTQYVEKLTNA